MQAKDFKYKGHRNSYTELNEVYFWTITVNQWQHLLKADENKMIMSNLNNLINSGYLHILAKYSNGRRGR